MITAQGLLGLATLAVSQVYDISQPINTPSSTADTASSITLGNYYNYWQVSNNTYDLTRSDRLPVTSPKTVPMLGKRQNAIIEPSRTAFVIVDMQNFFLHPQLSPRAVNGRKAVQPTLDMIDAFRAEGMKVLWVNWGLNDADLLAMPPSTLEGFSSNGTMEATFGSEMGELVEEDGMVVDVGRKLWRGAWNARPWGSLNGAMEEGLANGTDLYFNKNRLSGLWGAQTPLGLYLQESQTTTLFIGGVNSDQCVWSTFVDAFVKGFDVVYVEDCAGTTSPWFSEEMVRYNANHDGFLANSTYVIEALKEQR